MKQDIKVTSDAETNATETHSNSNYLSPYSTSNFMAPPIGGTVKCTTCLNNTLIGKVMAYDQQTKMLALRSQTSKSGLYDVSIVNANWCQNLELIEEPKEPPETLANLNMQKLGKRVELNIKRKYKEIDALGNGGVSTLAQHLYFKILQTLNEVEWNDKQIIVMKSVSIDPPYTPQSCFIRADNSTTTTTNTSNTANNSTAKNEHTQTLEHVKKIVKKFNDEYMKQQQLEQLEQSNPSSPNNGNINVNN
jgi:16S rRNA G966 N2-methylase RsmD